MNLNGFNNKVLSIKKIHPLFRECLLTQGNETEKNKLFCKKFINEQK